MVEITSIDHFCRLQAVTPDILKIDVDGYEARCARRAGNAA